VTSSTPSRTVVRPRPHVLLRPAALALQALALVAIVGGTTAFVTFDKTVTLSVDGRAHQVRSFSRTVGDVLRHEGIVVGPHDVVAPSTDSALQDDGLVVVRYGRLLTLDIDGRQRKVWTTARTLDEALDQIGLRLDGAQLSASRSMPLGRAGLSVDVRLPKHVTFLADGDRHEVDTTAATLADALTEAQLTLGKADRISAPVTSAPQDDEVVTITRVSAKTSTDEKQIAFHTVKKATDQLYKGTTKVTQRGVVGVRRLTYADTYTDGKLTAHELVDDVVTRQPVDQIVLVGTKARPQRSYSGVSGVSSLNWAALARCESGGNPKAVNPAGPYYGLYQFSASTWHSMGGSGIPTQASSSEQTYRAQLLYKRSGAGQWPVCGSKLYS
jgi:uncharacterized protein YabE (DUF348 family)